MEASESAVRQALSQLLKPLIRLLLRNGIEFAEFADVARKAYVDVAEADFAVPNRKQTSSRIAVLTGIHRREVNRLRNTEITQISSRPRKRNRVSRVIAGWLDDPEFNTPDGKPRPLDFATDFLKLVQRHGGDIPARAVLDELLRVEAAQRLDDDRVVLIVDAYAPTRGDAEWFSLMGESAADLLATLDHNFESEAAHSRLQLSVAYDNISDEALAQIRAGTRDRSMVFLQEINRYLRAMDSDCSPEATGSGRNRVGIGLYFFENPTESNDE